MMVLNTLTTMFFLNSGGLLCALYEILLELPCLEGTRKRYLSYSLFITYLTIR